MNLNEHISELLLFNDQANKQLLEQIKAITGTEEAMRLLSHIINAQNKWAARLLQKENEQGMSWWEPVYSVDELEKKLTESLNEWLALTDMKSEGVLTAEFTFPGADGSIYATTIKDIALHLNYHSIHHRAQILRLMREQGNPASMPDYIRTKIRKVS